MEEKEDFPWWEVLEDVDTWEAISEGRGSALLKRAASKRGWCPSWESRRGWGFCLSAWGLFPAFGKGNSGVVSTGGSSKVKPSPSWTFTAWWQPPCVTVIPSLMSDIRLCPLQHFAKAGGVQRGVRWLKRIRCRMVLLSAQGGSGLGFVLVPSPTPNSLDILIFMDTAVIAREVSQIPCWDCDHVEHFAPYQFKVLGASHSHQGTAVGATDHSSGPAQHRGRGGQSR